MSSEELESEEEMSPRNNAIQVDFQELKENRRITVASITGSLDSYTSRGFQQTMVQQINRGLKHLIVDCAHLEYMSSAGLGSLLVVSEEVGSDGFVIFCNLQSDVFHVFTMVGAAALFTICESHEDAVTKALTMLDHAG